MAAMPRSVRSTATLHLDDGQLIPRAAIRRFARQVVARFQPDKIILFGSYAYGEPNADSDVDLLVVMPARNVIDQAVKVRFALPDPPFPLDLIVRTPSMLRTLLNDRNSFISEIVGKGKVLYEKGNGRMGSQSRSRPRRRPQTVSRGPTRP